LVYDDDVNVLGESAYTIKENRSFLVVRGEIGIEVFADKTKYSGTSVHKLNSFLEAVRELKCS
jgi:hypothetical protein